MGLKIQVLVCCSRKWHRSHICAHDELRCSPTESRYQTELAWGRRNIIAGKTLDTLNRSTMYHQLSLIYLIHLHSKWRYKTYMETSMYTCFRCVMLVQERRGSTEEAPSAQPRWSSRKLLVVRLPRVPISYSFLWSLPDMTDKYSIF